MAKHDVSRKQFLSYGAGLVGAGILSGVGCQSGGDRGGSGGDGAGGDAAGGDGGGSNNEGGSSGDGGNGGSSNGGSGGSGEGGSGGSANGGSGSGGSASGGSGGSAKGGAGGSAKGGAGGSAGGGGAGGNNSAMCTGAITAVIGMNHNQGEQHTLMIPLADITAGVAKVYKTGGPAGHMHDVPVTAADFTMLKAGMTVRKQTCGLGPHQYALSCGAAPTPANPVCT